MADDKIHGAHVISSFYAITDIERRLPCQTFKEVYVIKNHFLKVLPINKILNACVFNLILLLIKVKLNSKM